MPGTSVAHPATTAWLLACTYGHSDALYDVSVGNYRHFAKEELPRIQYANPTIAIEVNKVPKIEADTWQSSLYMEFGESLLVLILMTKH